MVIFLCLLIFAIGYFLGEFLMGFGFFEAGVGIYAFCDARSGDYSFCSVGASERVVGYSIV
jgi:hypothetical protein